MDWLLVMLFALWSDRPSQDHSPGPGVPVKVTAPQHLSPMIRV